MATKHHVIELPISTTDLTTNHPRALLEIDESYGYSDRRQWIRPAVLGANDGLVSTTLMIMSVGAVRPEVKVMILTGLMGLVTGACSMAIGEFVSVSSQLDIEKARLKREKEIRVSGGAHDVDGLPNPLLAAWASFVSYSGGATVPILVVTFIEPYKARLVAVMVVFTLASLVFGWFVAVVGRGPRVMSSLRGLFGGWLAIGITFGLSKLVGSHGL